MKKMLLVGVVGLSALLGGCANTSELETSVQNLSNKVDQLAQDVSAVRADQSKMQLVLTSASTTWLLPTRSNPCEKMAHFNAPFFFA